MSEFEEIKKTEIKRLSPSAINSYFKCPREFYYNYIEKIKVPQNIHLVKGSVVHKVLELFFKESQKDGLSFIRNTFKQEWKKTIEDNKSIELSKKELLIHKKDAFNMLNTYYDSYKRKVDNLIDCEKAENEEHAFYLLRPKFRELWVEWQENEAGELHTGGYIDRVDTDFNGVTTIMDYKTSSKFGVGLPEDYRRQVSLYGFLYEKQKGKTPDFVGINFLRYGEEYLIEVTPSMMKHARNSIKYVWDNTRTTNIEDYNKKESNLCKYCQFYNHCNKQEEFEKSQTKERLIKFKGEKQ